MYRSKENSIVPKEASDEEDDLLDELFPIPKPARNLMIFDGTANQKVPILMWMGDQVVNRIRETRAKTTDESKKIVITLIERRFRSVLSSVRVNAYDITESTSCFPEHSRKEAIEKYARIIQNYRREVERLANETCHESTQSSPINQDIPVGQNSMNNMSDQQGFTTPYLDSYEIPRAAVPMTRIKGFPDSIYVSPKPKGINIHELAYADQSRQSANVPYSIDLNETYEEVLQGVPKNLTYVGAKYPDGTSLSYLPIKDITLLREQSFVQLPTQEEGGVVELKMPKVIYDKIKRLCSSAYMSRYPGHILRYPHESLVESKVIKVQALARGYRRLRIINGKRTFHVTLLQALEKCSHDMTGDGLLHLRFDRPNSDDKRATMKLVFFGLQMVRDPSNHFQKIFRL